MALTDHNILLVKPPKYEVLIALCLPYSHGPFFLLYFGDDTTDCHCLGMITTTAIYDLTIFFQSSCRIRFLLKPDAIQFKEGRCVE